MAFYGLKLFSGPIFAAINPEGDLIVQNGYLLLNNIIALVAYYIAACIIDIPSIGRKKVQIVFFLLVSIIFLIMSSIFESSSSGLLMALFFLSSFVGQFVNTTTYVVRLERQLTLSQSLKLTLTVVCLSCPYRCILDCGRDIPHRTSWNFARS
jgi:hypothetical protein